MAISLLLWVSVFSQSNTKPNVVLINMDNFGYGELGCYGGGIIRGAATPRIPPGTPDPYVPKATEAAQPAKK